MAVLIFAGIILKEWKSGPHYAVWPFFYVRRATRNSIQVDFGTLDEDTVARADRSEESISWFVMREPIRINWGDFKSLRLTPPGILIPSEDKIKEYNEDLQKRYANDPYANTLTTDPHLFFRFRIFNLQWLIERVGGLDEAMERIKDTCVSSLSEEAGKTFVAKARQELDSLSDNIHLSVEKLVGDPDAIRDDKCEAADSWGIDIEEVKIKDIGAPRTSNVALAQRAADIANADGKATATIRAAGAEKIRLVETAEGEATATERKATAERKRLEEEGTGRANALKVVAEQASTRGGELVLKTDTLKEVMTANEGKIVIVPTDLSGLTGAILGAVEAVKTPPGGGPKNPPAPSR
jgi:regulator of protease activity HflC (stomatin/prohibitin superfamily)